MFSLCIEYDIFYVFSLCLTFHIFWCFSQSAISHARLPYLYRTLSHRFVIKLREKALCDCLLLRQCYTRALSICCCVFCNICNIIGYILPYCILNFLLSDIRVCVTTAFPWRLFMPVINLVSRAFSLVSASWRKPWSALFKTGFWLVAFYWARFCIICCT